MGCLSQPIQKRVHKTPRSLYRRVQNIMMLNLQQQETLTALDARILKTTQYLTIRPLLHQCLQLYDRQSHLMRSIRQRVHLVYDVVL